MKRGFFTKSELPVLKQHDSQMVPQCGSCGLLKTCKSPKMEPFGRGKKDILIVGEAPGEDEDEQGIPMVGRTGQDVRSRLGRLGIDLDKHCVRTNALICRPPGNKIHNNMAVSWCRPNVIETIKETNPKLIILFGGAAIESVIGWTWGKDVGAVSRWAGYAIPDQKLNAWIVPTFHPSYLMRNANPVGEIIMNRCLELAASLIGKGRPWKEKQDWPDEVELVFGPREGAWEISQMTKDGGVFSFDYETNMLKPHHDSSEIVCCSISDGERTIAFPWSGPVQDEMRKFFRRKDCKKIASNLMMEDGWSRVFGSAPRGWFHDTMLCAHAVENTGKVRNIAGLKFQSYVHFGLPDYDSHLKPYLISKDDGGYAKNRVRQADIRQVMKYCGVDSLAEWRLAEYQCEQLGKKWPR